MEAQIKSHQIYRHRDDFRTIKSNLEFVVFMRACAVGNKAMIFDTLPIGSFFDEFSEPFH